MQQSLFSAAVAAQPEESTSTQSTNIYQFNPQTALTDAVFTVIDLETTGLNAKKNAITEITAIQFKNGEEIGKYSTLVKPTEPISEEVTNITGIDNEMVKDAPALVMVLSELGNFVGENPIIVGHNVSFDIGFLHEKFEQESLSAFKSRFKINQSFCTKVLAQKALPGLPSYQGVVVATACGVVNPNPHRAEADVRMSGQILTHLIGKLSDQCKTVGELQTYQGELRLR